MRLSRAVPTAVIGLAACSSPALAAPRTFLAVPRVDWGEIQPYVRANVVPSLSGDEFHVYVCSEQTLRSAVASYDESTGDFVKALLYRLLFDDHRFAAAIDRSTEEFRRRIPSWSASERASFRESYWDLLARSEDFLPRVKREFEAVKRAGRMRCKACDKDPSLYPAAKRWND